GIFTDPPPAIAGGGKKLTGDVSLGGSAALTTKFPGGVSATTEFGKFALGPMMNAGGFAGHWQDGIIGSGLQEPVANPVRPNWQSDESFAGKVEAKGASVAAAMTTQFLEGYVGYSGDWGNINILGDVDHDSFGNVTITALRAYDLGVGLNLGSALAALQLQAGLGGAGRILQDPYNPTGSIEAVLNLQTLNRNLPGIEIAGGGLYKTSPIGPGSTAVAQELLPSAYVFIPALAPGFPSLLAGLASPYTVAASTPTGNTGFVASPFGDESGWTIQVVYDNPILPNLTIETDLQQDVLFSNSYKGFGVAISSSVDF
ncbi:MAG: hypothetical protein KGR26_17080, partial [Cyanobacteria bacterium REEB65]|nr:hypothetical protein [Cyanobacteria bacterium REEB65]